ncbi:D-inositol-3-phosphate glycosyltransferase [ANME-1 cluster archaeon GoMg2]|nr:D-inositol-3-phosphate glycosyltransferase [ANME-1 cluster archaeon GoMg2]
MKICQVVSCFPYREYIEGTPVEKGYHIGGVERHVLEISKALIKRGHFVTVLTTRAPHHKNYHEINEFEIVRVPYGVPLYSSSIPFSIFRYLDPDDYDLIHAHAANPTIADLACLKNFGKIPFILTYHNDITKERYAGKMISYAYNKTLGDFLLKNSNVIIATTKSYAEKSIRLKRFKHKIRVIPNGVNLNTFNKNIDEKKIRIHHSIPIQSKIILFVGALEMYKGIKYLLKAFKQVLNYEMTSYLVIVGAGTLSKQLKEMTVELKISDNVIFAGYVKDSDLPYYYSACDIFVLPSTSSGEGFGIVQIEALACGKPVICTDLPGVNEVDPKEVASIHVPPKDCEALADAILKLLENEKIAREMGEKGRKFVEEKYTWDKVSEMTEEVYLSLVE